MSISLSTRARACFQKAGFDTKGVSIYNEPRVGGRRLKLWPADIMSKDYIAKVAVLELLAKHEFGNTYIKVTENAGERADGVSIHIKE